MTLSQDEVLKMRAKYSIGIPKQKKESGFLQGFMDTVRDIPQDVKDTAEGIGESFNKLQGNVADQLGTDTHPAVTGARIAGRGLQFATEAVGEVGLGIAKTVLPESAEEAVRDQVRAFGETSAGQTLGQTLQVIDEDENLGPVFGVAGAALEVGGFGAAVRAVRRIGEPLTDFSRTAIQSSKQALEGVDEVGAKGVQQANSLGLDPAAIMQRVARINKSKQADFESRFGTPVGQYLVDRKVFGDVDQISNQLFARFAKSKGEVDKAMAGLEGQFKSPVYGQALKQILDREQSISKPGAISQDLELVKSLDKRHKAAGLSFSEMNQVKRLFERNVKLDFVKDNLATKVAEANNLDKALREFQFTKASEAGFNNLPELNKETAMAKTLLDDLGKEYSGQAGNNAISLTDWLILSEVANGGAGTAAGFFAKKAFDSKSAQSAMAKFLSENLEGAKPPEALIQPYASSYLDFIKSIESTPNKKGGFIDINATIEDMFGTKVKFKGKDYVIIDQKGASGDKFLLREPDSLTEVIALKSDVEMTSDTSFLDNKTNIYGMNHRPSKSGSGHDITDQEALPGDVYETPHFYFKRGDKAYEESWEKILAMRGKPDSEVIIYRASPKNELNEGDWVTLSKTYAEQESLVEGVQVNEFTVRAKDLQFAGDDLNEFGFFPVGKK